VRAAQQRPHQTRAFFQHLDLLIERGISPPGAMHFFYDLSRLGLYQGDFPLTVEEGSQKLAVLLASRQQPLGKQPAPAPPSQEGDQS
jgi:hypothetical protein